MPGEIDIPFVAEPSVPAASTLFYLPSTRERRNSEIEVVTPTPAEKFSLVFQSPLGEGNHSEVRKFGLTPSDDNSPQAAVYRWKGDDPLTPEDITAAKKWVSMANKVYGGQHFRLFMSPSDKAPNCRVVGPVFSGCMLHDALKIDSLLVAYYFANIIHQIACRLQTMHEQGIIHRDIKETNLFLGEVPETRELLVWFFDFELSALEHENVMLNSPAERNVATHWAPESFATLDMLLARRPVIQVLADADEKEDAQVLEEWTASVAPDFFRSTLPDGAPMSGKAERTQDIFSLGNMIERLLSRCGISIANTIFEGWCRRAKSINPSERPLVQELITLTSRYLVSLSPLLTLSKRLSEILIAKEGESDLLRDLQVSPIEMEKHCFLMHFLETAKQRIDEAGVGWKGNLPAEFNDLVIAIFSRWQHDGIDGKKALPFQNLLKEGWETLQRYILEHEAFQALKGGAAAAAPAKMP